MKRRNTVQKKLVLETIQKLKTHLTADEIYAYIHKEYPTISKGTVYRNLNILVEEGLLRRVEISGGADCFDFTLKNHYPIRCIQCKKVYDVDMDELGEINHLIHNAHGFQFLSYDVCFKGICPNCSKI